MLISAARSYMEGYYPMHQEEAFDKEVEDFYNGLVHPSDMWKCKFYSLLALGDIWSTRNYGVALQTRHFAQARGLMPSTIETPSVLLVEAHVLLTWACEDFGRIVAASSYCMRAMQIALSLNMHLEASVQTESDEVEQEARRRTWWQLYVTDRYSATMYGRAIEIRDNEIDIRMPSIDIHERRAEAGFQDALPFIAHISLAKIAGTIINDFYGIPEDTKGTHLVVLQQIHRRLRQWHDTLSKSLSFEKVSKSRGVANLHLMYNHCIILTIRPIYHYYFRARKFLGIQPVFCLIPYSSIVRTIVKACVDAAISTACILERLLHKDNIAKSGFWDAYHAFSAALILQSDIVVGDDEDDLPKLPLNVCVGLLQTMVKAGNIPAANFRRRLLELEDEIIDYHGLATFDPGNPVGRSLNREESRSLFGGSQVDSSWIENLFEKRGSIIVLASPSITRILDEAKPLWEKSQSIREKRWFPANATLEQVAELMDFMFRK